MSRKSEAGVDFRGGQLPWCDRRYHWCPPLKEFMGGFLPDTEEGAVFQLQCLASARTKTGSEGD